MLFVVVVLFYFSACVVFRCVRRIRNRNLQAFKGWICILVFRRNGIGSRICCLDEYSAGGFWVYNFAVKLKLLTIAFGENHVIYCVNIFKIISIKRKNEVCIVLGKNWTNALVYVNCWLIL